MENNILINRALEELEKQTGIDAWYQEPAPHEKEIDGILKFTYNKEPYQFYIEVKKELRNHQLPQLENLNKRFYPLMLIAEYIFLKIKEELRNLDIAWLETNGNAHIKEKGLILWLEN
jgi:hypothetical protein